MYLDKFTERLENKKGLKGGHLMYSKTVTVRQVGPSYSIAELVQLACNYSSQLRIKNLDGEFNVKSIMGMMSLDPTAGTLYITGSGADEREAVDAIAAFFEK